MYSSLHRLGRATVCALVFCMLSGCLQNKFYVDPAGHRATYLSVHPLAQPQPVVVAAEFQVNGKAKPSVQATLQRRIEKVLAATRIFLDAPEAQREQAARLSFTVNDIANIGAAVGKGALTGLTLGLAGSEAEDRYEMTASYRPANGDPVVKTYKHALHMTIGLHEELKNLKPVAPGDAFDQILEDMVLNFLEDLQKQGVVVATTTK